MYFWFQVNAKYKSTCYLTISLLTIVIYMNSVIVISIYAYMIISFVRAKTLYYSIVICCIYLQNRRIWSLNYILNSNTPPSSYI